LTAVGSCTLLFGGASMEGEHFGDLWQLQCSAATESRSGSWKQLQPAGPAPAQRSGHTATATAAGLLLFGGADAVQDITYSDVWLFSLSTFTWTQLQCSGDSPALTSHTAVLSGSSTLVVFGGVSAAGPSSAVWSLDLTPLLQTDSSTTLQWTRRSCTGNAPAAREMHTATPVSTAQSSLMVVVGGRLEDGAVTKDTYALDVATWQWGQRSPCPVQRCAHTAWCTATCSGKASLQQLLSCSSCRRAFMSCLLVVRQLVWWLMKGSSVLTS
jgi:Galactose oxidase, central domain